MSEGIPVPPETLAHLLVNAVRYALGRRSYIVDTTCDWVRQFAGQMTPNLRKVLIRDIREQERLGYGDPCDEQNWRDLLAWLQERFPEDSG